MSGQRKKAFAWSKYMSYPMSLLGKIMGTAVPKKR